MLRRPTRLSALILPALLVLPGTPAGDLRAQTVQDLMAGLQAGGGWVEIPVTEGVGTFRTVALPTMGLTFKGCAKIWEGHSGTWEVQARDALGTERLDAVADPGEPILFDVTAGRRSQLVLEVRWSEPRDTTLVAWIGLEGRERTGEAACVPRETGGG